MERSREAKKLNGMPKRRQRSTGFRDSTEDGVAKKERDREYELLNPNKRRKGDKLVQGSGRDEEESAEDSLYEEEDSEAEQSNRKMSKTSRVATNSSASTVVDEVIGVPVPRRSRSGRKMLLGSHHHSGVMYRFDGHMEEKNCWRPWPWATSRGAESPSSSSVSIRKKMKPNGTQTNESSFSSSVNEDIEIEVAEVLYGLMKLSNGTKDDDKGKSADEHEPKDANDLSGDTNQSIVFPAVRPSDNHTQPSVHDDHKSDSLFSSAPKKNEAEAGESGNPVPSASIAVSEAENEQAAKLGTSPQGADIVARSSLDFGAANHHLDKGSSVEESNCLDDSSVTENKSAQTKEGSAKLGSDPMDPTVTKPVPALEEAESQRQDKCKIDLMASPPTVSSPERVGILDLALQCNQKDENREVNSQISLKNERLVVKDRELDDSEGRITRLMPASLKLDLEKHNNSGSGSKLEKCGSKELLPKTILPKWEKNVQSSSLPSLPLALAGWSTTIPPLGLLPPFQIPPMDGGAASRRSLQSHILFSQPRPKRCCAHGHIAHSIHLHQQYVKLNPFFPAAASSASTCGGKINNVNGMSPAGNLIIGNSSQGDFPAVNLNNRDEKGQTKLNLAGHSKKNKSSDGNNLMDTTQKKQFILQQGSRPASAGSLMHAPAFVFPNNQSGPSAATATNTNTKAQVPNNIPAGTSSALLLGPTAALSSSCTNWGSSETPYLTILQNNGYPFAISAPAGNPAGVRVGAPGQVLPIFNGSVYSSQIFPQLQQQQQQQQQPRLQPLIQPANHSISTSTGSSSTSKPPERQKQHGAQVAGSTSMRPINMLSHQKSVYGQKAVSQPINFTLVSPATIATSNGVGNQSEQQQLSQQKCVKGAADLIPSQAFAVSFGHNIPSNLNFSSMAHSPAILHSLPGVAQPGYQVASVLQTTQQKTQMSDGKTASSSVDTGKKGLGKSHSTGGSALVFDNAARTLSFASSPATGNWSACSITPTSLPANQPMVSSSLNSQQKMLQLQKQQHILQHQSGGTSRSKGQTTSSLPASSIAAKFSSNAAAFSQDNSSGPSNWKNLKMPSSQVPHSASATLNSKSDSQQLTRSPNGQAQISFGGNSKPTLLLPAQQVPPVCGKTGSGGTTLQPQHGENSNGPGQKTSPACARNVPSILSTCPSHLSELKY